jgi:hypothetical protein
MNPRGWYFGSLFVDSDVYSGFGNIIWHEGSFLPNIEESLYLIKASCFLFLFGFLSGFSPPSKILN